MNALSHLTSLRTNVSCHFTKNFNKAGHTCWSGDDIMHNMHDHKCKHDFKLNSPFWLVLGGIPHWACPMRAYYLLHCVKLTIQNGFQSQCWVTNNPWLEFLIFFFSLLMFAYSSSLFMSMLNLYWININIMNMKRHMLICLFIFMLLSMEKKLR